MEGRNSLSSLKFLNYIVNSVNYKTNDNYMTNETGSWKLNFDITNTTKISKDKNKMTITLAVNVFKGIEDAPFYIDVVLTGYFELEGEDDISKYEANAIAIMYPYLRAIVSNYTSSANVSPVILPAVNVNAMLTKKVEKNLAK